MVKQPYRLSCHCGTVRYEVDAELENLLQCNCSTCRRFGAIHWYVNPARVTLLTPKIGMGTYLWQDCHGGHQFCTTCGTSIMRSGYPNGVIALNACMIEEVDVFALEVERYDGRTQMPPGVLP